MEKPDKNLFEPKYGVLEIEPAITNPEIVKNTSTPTKPLGTSRFM